MNMNKHYRYQKRNAPYRSTTLCERFPLLNIPNSKMGLALGDDVRINVPNVKQDDC